MEKYKVYFFAVIILTGFFIFNNVGAIRVDSSKKSNLLQPPTNVSGNVNSSIIRDQQEPITPNSNLSQPAAVSDSKTNDAINNILKTKNKSAQSDYLLRAIFFIIAIFIVALIIYIIKKDGASKKIK